jgi:indolepyruvate ferredoxin oxidoreductase, alpha subunit
MAERSFATEVGKLRASEGEEFFGEGILAVTKALLQSGVSYVGGYQGAPISHLMDVLGDAKEILDELGVHFENSASEATAAASLAASVYYPLRGAITFKSTVGTNVASDALANLASGGVTGGALIIVGEDYGEGSSIMQERSHAFAMKSQIWLLDPRPNLTAIVDSVDIGFRLSEASNSPVMLQLRLRSCHLHGRFIAKDNVKPEFTLRDAMENPLRDTSRIVLPPASFMHEQEKVTKRWPAAVKFIKDNKINELFADGSEDFGIVMQGGLYNTVIRSLQLLGLSDVYGNSKIPLYILNVTYPIIDDEVIDFANSKKGILLVEEGQPDYIEQNINAILRRAGVNTALHGKDLLPVAGEYTPASVTKGILEFVKKFGQHLLDENNLPAIVRPNGDKPNSINSIAPTDQIHARPPSFCTGCPERPIFTALKLAEKEIGNHHISADIGCHLFSILPPFNIGATTMGYGLGAAGASALHDLNSDKRTISFMGDGGFWHNGLTSGIGNAVFNKSDGLVVVVDNAYSAATGGQDLLSSSASSEIRSTKHPIERAVRGIGVEWAKTVSNTFKVSEMKNLFKEALTTKEEGPKVIVAQSECTLNKTRRERPAIAKRVKEGKRVVRERFGVDPDTCTGDHSCIRLNGCPSLTIKANPDPMRKDPVATVLNTCVGCGLCGEAAHAAVLCPSFYKTSIISNPSIWDRTKMRLRNLIIGALQNGIERRLVGIDA